MLYLPISTKCKLQNIYIYVYNCKIYNSHREICAIQDNRMLLLQKISVLIAIKVVKGLY